MYVSMASATSKNTIRCTLKNASRASSRSLISASKCVADELEVLAVGAEVPLRGEADPLVHRADAQPVLDVREVAAAREEAHEVLALGALDAADGRLVGEELAGLGMAEQQLVEALDDARP